MSVEKDKIESILIQLPEDLQHEVAVFAEFLLHRTRNGASPHEFPSVRSFFGVWDSGDSHSADNDQIDIDIACELSSPHEAD